MGRNNKNFQFNFKNDKNQIYLLKFINVNDFINKYKFYIEKEIFKSNYDVFNIKINNIVYNTKTFEQINDIKEIELKIKEYDLMKKVKTINDLFLIVKNNNSLFINNSNTKLLKYNIDRKCTYSVLDIYEIIKNDIYEHDNIKTLSKKKFLLNEDEVTPLSENMFTYFKNYKKEKEIKCCYCGMKASFFAKERFISKQEDKQKIKYHLSLYGVNTKGKEVLFTKDHINPKSRGGLNDISNYQTMCSKCNSIKGNIKEEEFETIKKEATIEGYYKYFWVVPIKENNKKLVYDVYSKKQSQKPFMRCPSNLVYIH